MDDLTLYEREPTRVHSESPAALLLLDDLPEDADDLARIEARVRETCSGLDVPDHIIRAAVRGLERRRDEGGR